MKVLTPQTAKSVDEINWLYNGADCVATYLIYEELSHYTHLTPYKEHLAKLAPLNEMAIRGIRVDFQERGRIAKVVNAERDEIIRQLDYIAKEVWGREEINWSSPHQVKDILYRQMDLPEQHTQGRVTSDKKALEKLRKYLYAQPIVDRLLLYSDLSKQLENLGSHPQPDGRIHSYWSTAGTKTGRLSARKDVFRWGTNLQNEDRRLRRCYIPDPGYVFIQADLPQADSRNLGAMCYKLFDDATYLDACESGDLHTTVVKMVFVDLPWGTAPDRTIANQNFYMHDSYRDTCKRLGHGTNFLGTPYTMALNTRIRQAVITEFQRDYFKAFPSIQKYHAWVEEQLEDSGTLTTLYDRRRRFHGRPSDPSTIREAVAYIPQSMTAHQIDEGMLKLWDDDRVQLLAQVHDSVLMQVRKEHADEICNEVIPAAYDNPILIGENDRPFLVGPIDIEVGMNWGKFNGNEKKGLLNLQGLKDWTIGSTLSSML